MMIKNNATLKFFGFFNGIICGKFEDSNLTAALEAKTVIFKPANPGTPFHFPLGSDWLNGAD